MVQLHQSASSVFGTLHAVDGCVEREIDTFLPQAQAASASARSPARGLIHPIRSP